MPYRPILSKKAELAKVVLQNSGIDISGNGEPCDVGSLEIIDTYFKRLHEIRCDRLDASYVLSDLETAQVSGGAPCFPFKSAAEHFRMIEEGSHPVVIFDPRIASDIEAVEKGYASRGALRRLARYSVGLYDNDLKVLRDARAIKSLADDLYVLLDCGLYQDDTGLDASDAGGRGLFY